MLTECRGEDCKKTSEHVSPITYHNTHTRIMIEVLLNNNTFNNKVSIIK